MIKPAGKKMKLRFLPTTFFLMIVISTHGLFALNTGGIIAYPVPFNPGNGVFTVGELPVNTTSVDGVAVDRISFTVFDINGDRVFNRNYNQMPVKWSGRNDSGKIVAPGFYIIKIVVEENATAKYGSRIIRILVKY